MFTKLFFGYKICYTYLAFAKRQSLSDGLQNSLYTVTVHEIHLLTVPIEFYTEFLHAP